MKACILVGGYGTRLRPLTFTTAKPLVPFCNLPMILHQIIALVECGVKEIIFMMSQESVQLQEEAKVWKNKYSIQFSFCYETEPLGTAGPLRLAVENGLLNSISSEPFFVLNSDIICEYPLRKLLETHYQSKGEGTLLVKRVENWSQYGVIDYEVNSGRIRAFIEKPSHFVGDKINAGIYVFDPRILNRIGSGKRSLEHEIFPAAAYENKLYCCELEGMWKDIGNPIDFLDAVPQVLDAMTKPNSLLQSLDRELGSSLVSESHDSASYTTVGLNIIDPSAQIHAEAVIGPNVTIAAHCKIGNGVRIDNSVVLSGTSIKDFSSVSRSIVGWNCSIGMWAHVIGESVLGCDVHIADRTIVNGVRALPHKSISSNIFEPKIIM